MDNAISHTIASSLPEYIRTEGPRFITFLEKYYEWLEQEGKILSETKQLLNKKDVDLLVDTSDPDTVYDYFCNELLPGSDFTVPENVNKSLLLKQIRKFYRNKGSLESLKFLFRILYEEEITVYYPREDILIPSNGRWVEEVSVRISPPFVGDPNDLQGDIITGQTTGSTARVLSILPTFEIGLPIYELFVTNLVGAFEEGEIVRNIANNVSGSVLSSVGPLQDINIIYGGEHHEVGDKVELRSASGSGATGTITEVGAHSMNYTFVDGGSGYRFQGEDGVEHIEITIISAGTGFGAEIRMVGNTFTGIEPIDVYIDRIEYMEEVPIGSANTYGDSNIANNASDELKAANKDTTLQAALGTLEEEAGTIPKNAIKLVSGGSNYLIPPTIQVIDKEVAALQLDDGNGGFKGDNARLIAYLVPGSIVSINIDSVGVGYNRDDQVDIVNLSRPSATDGSGSPIIPGVINYPGKYTDTKGFLSWNNRLQDNYYYQSYSYRINSGKSGSVYEDIVKKTTHPAGTKMFSNFESIEILSEADESDTLKHDYRPDILKNTIEDVRKMTGTDSLYLFIGKPQKWNVEDIIPDVGPSRNDDVWVDMIGCKKIESNHISLAVPRYNWTSGTIYNQYPSSGKFFVITDVTPSGYNVYKCIDNNNGSPSTVEPTGISPSISGPFADGYRWKFMYNISNADIFINDYYIPIKEILQDDDSPQWNVQQTAIAGAIDRVQIDAIGNNYDFHTGTFANTSGSISSFGLDLSASSGSGSYANSSIFILSGPGNGELRNIISYNGATREVTVDEEFAARPTTESEYYIGPKVTITGGGGTGAKGYASVFSNNSIDNINIVNVGRNYGSGTTIDIGGTGAGATATPILSPAGGHGANANTELGGNNIIVDVRLELDELATSDFRSYGIIRSPLDQDGSSADQTLYDQTTKLQLNGATGIFESNQVITGLTSSATGHIVSYKDDIINITNINGTFTQGEIIENEDQITASISSITSGELQAGSGQLIYIKHINPITRKSTQIEDFKTIINY